jgi:thymidylate synthase
MQQYLNLLREIVDGGEDVQSGAVIQSEGRKATCRFLLAPQLRFDLRRGFPAVTTKKLLFDWVVDEVMWFLRGETNINTLGRQVGRQTFTATDGTEKLVGMSQFVKRPIWDKWAGPDGDVAQCYGTQWRSWEYPVVHPDGDDTEGNPIATVETWDQVVRNLADMRAVKADPSNRARRRIILTAWNPPRVPEMALAPCHTMSQWLPTNGYLDCVCQWRSIDTFTGMPFNIAQYALLTHIFARLAGLLPRRLVCNITDCHVYDNQYEQIAEQCAREPFPSPFLKIDDRFWRTAPGLSPAELAQVDHSWFSLVDYEYHKGRLKAEVAV